MITAEQAARALVASARAWDVDPMTVFDAQHEGVRIGAAMRCGPWGSERVAMLSRVFQIANPVCRPAGAAA